ncbi:uncharacterized protein LOC118411973 [Branchiostoma floridae]|uniref:Uncharacterized protein LOC118411973 n=1 Tax=Branchiostoma floridae TaxID=7739 RepID=A0A9J7KTP2_BRAFL|nr:uncharacterized protein LOC118411973 [Branchiostoma floridae]
MATSVSIILHIFLFIDILVLIAEAKPVFHQDGELRNARSAEHKKKGGMDMGLLNSMLNLKPTIEPVDLPEAVAVTAQENFRDKLGKRKNKKGNEVDMGLLNSFLNLEPTIEPIDLPNEVAVTAAVYHRDNFKGEEKKGNSVDMDLLNSFLNLKPTVEPVDLPEAVKVTAAPMFREVKEQGKESNVHHREEHNALNRIIDGLLESVDKVLEE